MSVYKIQYRIKKSNSEFKDEKFFTNGSFYSYKKSIEVKNKLEKMTSSIEYKRVRL